MMRERAELASLSDTQKCEFCLDRCTSYKQKCEFCRLFYCCLDRYTFLLLLFRLGEQLAVLL